MQVATSMQVIQNTSWSNRGKYNDEITGPIRTTFSAAKGIYLPFIFAIPDTCHITSVPSATPFER